MRIDNSLDILCRFTKISIFNLNICFGGLAVKSGEFAKYFLILGTKMKRLSHGSNLHHGIIHAPSVFPRIT